MNYILPDCLDENGVLLPSAQLVDVARRIAGERMIVAFSGRDSLCCWLVLREAGVECIPYFCYTVPGLSYDDEMLDYYERALGTHIIRLPHPRTYILLNCCAWQPPECCGMLRRARLPTFEYADIERALAEQFELGDNYLVAVGIKAADNLQRLRMIRQQGTIGLKKRHFYYTIWDWKTADVKACIERHGLKLSKSYIYFGSTGDGIDYRFLRYLRDNLPADYNRVLALFPEAELELIRYEAIR